MFQKVSNFLKHPKECPKMSQNVKKRPKMSQNVNNKKTQNVTKHPQNVQKHSKTSQNNLIFTKMSHTSPKTFQNVSP